MKNTAHVKWLSRLDMEPLLSAILGGGMLLSIGLMLGGFLLSRAGGLAEVGYGIHAISLPRLIQNDLLHSAWPDFFPRLMIDLGFATLLITPYVRLVVTSFYLCLTKKRWKYAVYTGLTSLLLGIILFSDIVLSAGTEGVPHWRP